MRPIGIDLFAGAGGLSLGFEQAGFDVRAAVEIDPIHCAIHQFNFPDTAVLPRSVIGLSAADIRDAAALAPGDRVDVVFGGPPCQGFSMIGQRALDDPRNRLVHEFVRIVAELDARSFVFENVKGLTLGRHRAFLEEVVEAFSDAGYDIRLPWRVVDAADFGVPQHRHRLILVGARRGERVPEYPKPVTSAADAAEPGLLPRGPTVRDALGDLPDADAFEELAGGDTVMSAPFGKPSAYAAEMRGLTPDASHFAHPRKWDAANLTSSWQTEHTEISRRRFSETQGGDTEPISRFFKLSADGLSNTLRAGTDGARGAFTSPRPIHYAYDRCITVREMARLHGFPDWFRFHVTKWHGARQVGNAVPPPLARMIAAEVISALGVTPTRPSTALELGPEELLHTTMSKAADTLGVEAPLSRRDRRSGTRKRSQHETETERLALLSARSGSLIQD